MNRLFITGDLHGEIDVGKLSSHNWKTGKELDKQDYLIIAGDFGFLWKNELDKTEEYWLSWFNRKPWTTLVVPGNHENYDRIFSMPITEMFGGKVRVYNDSVIFLERGELYTIAGRTFYTIGGGLSVDREWRTLGQSYWKQELLTHEETEYCIENLQTVHGEVEFIITHAAPRVWVDKVLGKISFSDIRYEKFNDPTSTFLEELLNVYIYKYKCWFFGHYHIDIDLYDEKAKGLYYDIVEIVGDEYIDSK